MAIMNWWIVIALLMCLEEHQLLNSVCASVISDNSVSSDNSLTTATTGNKNDADSGKKGVTVASNVLLDGVPPTCAGFKVSEGDGVS